MVNQYVYLSITFLPNCPFKDMGSPLKVQITPGNSLHPSHLCYFITFFKDLNPNKNLSTNINYIMLYGVLLPVYLLIMDQMEPHVQCTFCYR